MKVSRQLKIIELITKYDIETQENLVERLTKAGYQVTQATISRDIRELKLNKIAIEGNRQKYVVLQSSKSSPYQTYVRILSDGLISMESAQNILVLKTVSGMAMAVAAALDSLEIDGIVGCIAGDDTIMCAIRNKEEMGKVIGKLNKLVVR